MNGATTLAGQLPDRGSDWSGASTGYNRFTCNFGFRQRYKTILSVDSLFLDQENYIVQGSNNVRPFETYVSTETTPPLSELEDAASTTSTG
jgi:hypothetical protein